MYAIRSYYAFSCVTDEDKLYSLDYIQAPANVDAVFDITQDNTGVVTVVPNAEGAVKYTVDFGDGSTFAEISNLKSVNHTYTEGVYSVVITAYGISGLTTQVAKELNVTFKAPEDLVVITSYSIHYTKLYEINPLAQIENTFNDYNLAKWNGNFSLDFDLMENLTATTRRITSYNVCYTKLLRQPAVDRR